MEPALAKDVTAFKELAAANDDPEATKAAHLALVTQVNGKCKARCIDEKLPLVSNAIYNAVNERGWWRKDAPQLLTCEEDQVAVIASVVSAALKSVAQTTSTLPYSLVTKYLHYIFPDTFASYDSRIGASINAWVRSVYGSGTGPNSSRQRYMAESLSSTDGAGYIGILRFHRTFWDAVTGEDNVEPLEEATKTLKENLQALPTPVNIEVHSIRSARKAPHPIKRRPPNPAPHLGANYDSTTKPVA